MQANTLIILHPVSCFHYIGNKVKEKIKVKEEVAFLSMAFFCFFNKKTHYFDFSVEVLQCTC